MSNGVRRWLRMVKPDRKTIRRDAVAGVPGAIASVPDGMAASVLIGVSPIHGLWAATVGRLVGGLSSSSQLMIITTTSAAALAAGSSLSGFSADEKPGALFMMTLLAGVMMVLAGVLKLSRYVRFVPHSVMLGFLAGVAANIVLSQLVDLTGVQTDESTSLSKAIHVVTHPLDIDAWTLAMGVLALVILIIAGRSPLSRYGALFALAIPTAIVAIFDLSSVEVVSDAGAIPAGLPEPAIPQFKYIGLDTLSGALALAAIILVQGAGVAEGSPNPDGSRSDTGQDFTSQGAANMAAGLFQGQPVGGSLSQTVLNVSAGALSRWGAISSGIGMLLILLLFSGLVGEVAMTTLAAVLIYAAVSSIKLDEIKAVWDTGPNSKIGLGATFVATLLFPIQAAVGFGVVIAALLYLNRQGLDVSVVERVTLDDGEIEERPPPRHLADRSITVLDIYGSLFYAGARTLEHELPDPDEAHEPVVVLRMRGRPTLGSTFFKVLLAYGDRLHTSGGRLYLSGLDHALYHQFQQTAWVDEDDRVIRAFPATPILGESSKQAIAAARQWLDDRPDA